MVAPIYDRLRQTLSQEEIIYADETPVQILNRSDGRPATSDGHMWLFQTLDKADHPVVFYHASLTRECQNILDVLTDSFHSYCHCDGYSGYQYISGLTVVGCWTHMRRKFHEAGDDQGQAAIDLAYCNQLFALERAFKDLSPSGRKTQRHRHLRPIL